MCIIYMYIHIHAYILVCTNKAGAERHCGRDGRGRRGRGPSTRLPVYLFTYFPLTYSLLTGGDLFTSLPLYPSTCYT